MPETTSLKALAHKVLQRNKARNTHETEAFFNETKTLQKEGQSETKQAIDLSPYIGYYNERAAIREYDEKQTEAEAEHHARLETLKEFVYCEHP